MNSLDKEFQYYKTHQDGLVNKYNGRWIVIKDMEVVGDYPNQLEALRVSTEIYSPGTFIIQYVETGKKSYTQTFHSRVTS